MGGRQIDITGLINYGFLESIRRPLAIPILSCIRWLNNLTGSYGLSIILLLFLFIRFFPAEMALVQIHEESAETCAAHEGITARDQRCAGQRTKAERVQAKRIANGAIAFDEGRQSARRVSAALDSNAVSFALYTAITISIDFRQTSFLWIPDLSSAEPFLYTFCRF
jgi:membrane protein insertase Oxa1/YidC/SpoIIIJ